LRSFYRVVNFVGYGGTVFLVCVKRDGEMSCARVVFVLVIR
jgi:hypothetical protein